MLGAPASIEDGGKKPLSSEGSSVSGMNLRFPGVSPCPGGGKGALCPGRIQGWGRKPLWVEMSPAKWRRWGSGPGQALGWQFAGNIRSRSCSG